MTWKMSDCWIWLNRVSLLFAKFAIMYARGATHLIGKSYDMLCLDLFDISPFIKVIHQTIIVVRWGGDVKTKTG